jgi:hypothetical protein
MLTGRVRSGFVAGYLFILYWSYAVFGPDFFRAAGVGWAQAATYALFGLILITLLIYALFFKTDGGPSTFSLGRDILHLRKSLLRRMDDMEKAVLAEFHSRLRGEAWELGEIPQEIDAKLLALRPPLEEEKAMASWRPKRPAGN